MADTHVNAFYMNVDEKKQAVAKAQAELEEAERQLQEHPDYEAPEVEKTDTPNTSGKSKKK